MRARRSQPNTHTGVQVKAVIESRSLCTGGHRLIGMTTLKWRGRRGGALSDKLSAREAATAADTPLQGFYYFVRAFRAACQNPESPRESLLDSDTNRNFCLYTVCLVVFSPSDIPMRMRGKLPFREKWGWTCAGRFCAFEILTITAPWQSAVRRGGSVTLAVASARHFVCRSAILCS